MRWVAETQIPRLLRFVIEHDSKAGYYIYVYENARMIEDHLHDTLEIAKDFCLEKFQMPLEGWEYDYSPKALVAILVEPKLLHFKIINDLVMGPYLIVYEKNHRINDLKDKQYWFSSLDEARHYAWKNYQLPLNAWKKQY